MKIKIWHIPILLALGPFVIITMDRLLCAYALILGVSDERACFSSVLCTIMFCVGATIFFMIGVMIGVMEDHITFQAKEAKK